MIFGVLEFELELEFASALKVFLVSKKKKTLNLHKIFCNGQYGRKCSVFLLVNNYPNIHFPNTVNSKTIGEYGKKEGSLGKIASEVFPRASC